jgi:Anti-sigma-K factor rskA
MQHDELRALTGVYAVDAVDSSEAAVVERHLVGCQRCRGEVAELQEVAALLAFAGGPAPTRVWDGIAWEVGESSEPEPEPRPTSRRPAERSPVFRHHGVSRRVVAAVVALAATVIVGLGLQIGSLEGRAHRSASASSAQISRSLWRAAVATPSARRLTLRSSDGSRSAMAVVLSDGTSYLGPNNLPSISDEHSYQVWGKVGPTMVSLAVLRSPEAYQAFSTPAQTTALLITDEAATGVISTTNAPVVAASVPEPIVGTH